MSHSTSSAQAIHQNLISINQSRVLRSNEPNSGDDLVPSVVFQLVFGFAQDSCKNWDELLREPNDGRVLVFICSISLGPSGAI
jgi:hypothetical protein